MSRNQNERLDHLLKLGFVVKRIHRRDDRTAIVLRKRDEPGRMAIIRASDEDLISRAIYKGVVNATIE